MLFERGRKISSFRQRVDERRFADATRADDRDEFIHSESFVRVAVQLRHELRKFNCRMNYMSIAKRWRIEKFDGGDEPARVRLLDRDRLR